MNKEEAKKYISGRSLEIMCELELPQKEKWKERLAKEFAFLRYVTNLIDYAEEFAGLSDECDIIPGNTTFKEYKGYVLQQSGYNNHYMIFKNHSVVMHCQCNRKLDQKGAEEAIDFYIDLTYGKLAEKTKKIIEEQKNDNKSNVRNG